MDLDSHTGSQTQKSSRGTQRSEYSHGMIDSRGVIDSRGHSPFSRDDNRNWQAEKSILADVKSMYEVIHTKKRMGGNPNEPFIHRMVAVGELMEHQQRPELRHKIGPQYERLAKDQSMLLRKRGEDPVTGFVLIYPTQLFMVIESNWGTLINIATKIKETEENVDRIVFQYHIFNVAHDVTRQMQVFQTKLLNTPMPLPNWQPPGGLTETAAAMTLKRVLRQTHEMLKFLTAHGKDRKVLDSLVEQKPESVPDQDPLLFLCRSEILIIASDFLNKYASPFNLGLANDETWPSNWSGYRLTLPTTLHDKPSEAAATVWGVDLASSVHSSRAD